MPITVMPITIYSKQLIIKMKKIFLATALIAFAFTQSFAKNTTKFSQPSELLTQYYQIKDALVAGNSALAATNAEAFLKIANSIDYKIISEGNINALVKDATIISQTKDLKKQRAQFANLSANMVTLAKAMKLSKEPVYEVYCPMEKATWLSSSKTIKNPYLGKAMLTCGKVTETIQ
jgi:hypothetical protein